MSTVSANDINAAGRSRVHVGNSYHSEVHHHAPLERVENSGPLPGPHFIVPFPENKRFVGREGILRRLKDGLFDDDGCARSMAIVGLGGVGKTQVALQVAHHARRQAGWSVFWLSALSMTAFEQACMDMVEKLRLSASESKDAKQMMKHYLESSVSGQWLLIVDNADNLATMMDPGGVYSHLPKNGNGCVLFTTRVVDVAQAVADDTEELEKMCEDEAKAFLQKLFPAGPADRETVADLLHRLTFLPLAISQAAAYMKRNRTSVSKYLSLLRDVDKEAVGLLSREFPDRTRYPESRHAVASTWLVSFEQIQKNDEMAAKVLSFLSRIEPRAIPLSILPPTRTKESLEHAVGTLCGYAFLSRREDGETLDMHSLVHLAAREWIIRAGDAERTKREAVYHLATVFRPDDWGKREVWRKYLPHVLKAVQVSNEIEKWGKAECKLGFWAGRCLQVEGRIAEAVKLLEHLVKVRGTTLTESHPSRLASQHELAIAYGANGQVKEAVKLLQHVVKVQETTLADHHPDRLAPQHALAGAYEANGQVTEAVELLQYVVKVQETTLADHHQDRLASQHELARAYQANGQVKEAVELLEYVVKVIETTSAENHPHRLASQHALAGAYIANRQEKEAINLLQYVVKVRETTLAEDHPHRLASQHQLAVAYEANGQVKEAVELLEHVVNVQETVLADHHQDRLASQHALAVAFEANGQVKEAIELLKHVVRVKETTLAEDHPHRLASQHELARAYQANGQVKEAVELLQHVVQMRDTTLAENHPDRLASQYELAGAYHANGQVEEAVELLKHMVKVQETMLAEDHPHRLASQHALARAYRDNGQLKETVQLLKNVVKVRETTLAEDHLDRLTSQHALALAYRDNGQVKEAAKLLKHVVKVQETTLAEDHPSRLASQHNLAGAYLANGQVQEAAHLLEKVASIESQIMVPSHPSRQALEGLLVHIQSSSDGQVT